MFQEIVSNFNYFEPHHPNLYHPDPNIYMEGVQNFISHILTEESMNQIWRPKMQFWVCSEHLKSHFGTFLCILYF